jgi:peptidoglycan/LPS O-acetylase OafA/YrhL
MSMSMIQRRYDVDWLRAAATLIIFSRHCARFFDYDWWVVKNNQLDFGLTLLISIVDQWIMPLFFVLSGISAWYATSHRTEVHFIGDRFRRLVVPFIFGIFVIVPPQWYIEHASRSEFAGSFIEVLPHYFDDFASFWMGNSAHLWYLELLFFFAILALPFCKYLGSEIPRRLISKMAVTLQNPGMIILLAIPIAVMMYFLKWQPYAIIRTGWGAGGWSILTYLVFFILGCLIASDAQFKMAIERYRLVSLVIGILMMIGGLLWFRFGAHLAFPSILQAFNSWVWIVVIIGFGSKYLNFSNRLLDYSNEAVLPFYILHQTVIVIVGFYIAGWHQSVLAKYLILSTVSFVVIVALYHVAIRRVSILRFLFGLKSRGRSPQALAAG